MPKLKRSERASKSLPLLYSGCDLMIFPSLFEGFGIPLLLKQMRIDPAIAGSVVVTTVTDIVGLFVFLGLATVFLL